MTSPTLCYLVALPTPTGAVVVTLCGYRWQSRPHTSSAGDVTCPDCLRIGESLARPPERQ